MTKPLTLSARGQHRVLELIYAPRPCLLCGSPRTAYAYVRGCIEHPGRSTGVMTAFNLCSKCDGLSDRVQRVTARLASLGRNN